MTRPFSRPVGRVLRNARGFTLIELLIVIAIIGVLSAIAIPQFNLFKQRAYDSDARANLHNVFLACKAYWGDNISTSDCDLNIAANSYGFMQSANVNITINNGVEDFWNAQAQHMASTTPAFTQDPAGNIN